MEEGGGGGDWFRGWRKGMNIDHSLVREEIKLLTDQRYGRVELWVLFHRKKKARSQYNSTVY